MARIPKSTASDPTEKTETKERILSAALRLFNSQGTAGVSTNHIAEAAGLSVGNLYYHFIQILRCSCLSISGFFGVTAFSSGKSVSFCNETKSWPLNIGTSENREWLVCSTSLRSS